MPCTGRPGAISLLDGHDVHWADTDKETSDRQVEWYPIVNNLTYYCAVDRDTTYTSFLQVGNLFCAHHSPLGEMHFPLNRVWGILWHRLTNLSRSYHHNAVPSLEWLNKLISHLFAAAFHPFPNTIPSPYGVSWPSGLAYRTQVLVLAAECGFESRPWHLCPWARHLIIIASLHPGVKWVPVRAELVD